MTEPLDVAWKDLVDQRPSFRGQLAEHDSLVLGARAPAHQPTLFELLHDIRRRCAGQQNAVPNIAEWQRTLVVQHLEHRELGHAESALKQVRPDTSFERLQRAPEGDDQLQRCRPIAVGVGSRLAAGLRHNS